MALPGLPISLERGNNKPRERHKGQSNHTSSQLETPMAAALETAGYSLVTVLDRSLEREECGDPKILARVYHAKVWKYLPQGNGCIIDVCEITGFDPPDKSQRYDFENKHTKRTCVTNLCRPLCQITNRDGWFVLPPQLKSRRISSLDGTLDQIVLQVLLLVLAPFQQVRQKTKEESAQRRPR